MEFCVFPFCPAPCDKQILRCALDISVAFPAKREFLVALLRSGVRNGTAVLCYSLYFKKTYTSVRCLYNGRKKIKENKNGE